MRRLRKGVWFGWETSHSFPIFFFLLQFYNLGVLLKTFISLPLSPPSLISSPLVSFPLHSCPLLSLLFFGRCKYLQELVSLAVRTLEEGGYRLSIEAGAVSSSVQSQLWPQGGVIKMECRRCMSMPVCARRPDACSFSSTLCTVHLHSVFYVG